MTAAIVLDGLANVPTPDPATLLGRALAGLRTFFRIAERWGLGAQEARQLLGNPPKSTFYRWRDGHTGGVTLDTMERLSHVFGIYAALHRVFLEPARADEWLRRPNAAPLFGGQSALTYLLRGRVADLYEVRRYLESVAEHGR